MEEVECAHLDKDPHSGGESCICTQCREEDPETSVRGHFLHISG